MFASLAFSQQEASVWYFWKHSLSFWLNQYTFCWRFTFSTSALSVNENAINQQTYLYPNPAVDKFYLTSADKVSLEISDVCGKLLKTYNNIDKSNPIDISGLEDGVYFVSIINDTESRTIKLMKN